MNEQYKKQYDSIGLTEYEKNTIVIAMKNEEINVNKSDYSEYRFNKFIFRVAVSAMALLIIMGGTFAGLKFSNIPQKQKPKNSFVITVNAAEKEKLPEATIAMFSGESSSYFVVDKTYFYLYELTGLMIEGTNISKISMKSNEKFCYFSIDDNKDFSNHHTLNNSQYSSEKLDIGGINCDGFIYTNPNPSNEEQKIDLGKKVRFVTESDNSDKEMKLWLDDAYDLNMQQWEIRAEQRKKYGDEAIPISKEEQELSDKYDYRIRQVLEKTLRNSTITVEITFNDGTKQKQQIDVDFVMQDYEGVVIYDPRKNTPEELDMKAEEGYQWIAFRYSD